APLEEAPVYAAPCRSAIREPRPTRRRRSVLCCRALSEESPPMTAPPSGIPYAISLTAGLVLWSATAIVADGREPWDAESYWSASYPLAVVLAGVLGALFPDRPWRWALALMLSQIVVLAVNARDLSLLPAGVILLGILSLPAVGLAKLGAWIRKR